MLALNINKVSFQDCGSSCRTTILIPLRRLSLCKLFFALIIWSRWVALAQDPPCLLARQIGEAEVDYRNHPIIGVGLPKSGTASLYTYLKSIHPAIHSAHQLISKPCPDNMFPIPAIATDVSNVTWSAILSGEGSSGHCAFAYHIQRAVADGKKPLESLLDTGLNAFAQLDEVYWSHPRFPQVDLIDHILDAYPDAFYIHHIRNVTNHVASIMNWNDLSKRILASGIMSRQLSQGQSFSKSSSEQSIEEMLASFILRHREFIRDKFLKRPTVRYLEIDLELAEEMASASISIFVGARCIHKMAKKNHHPPSSTKIR